MSPTQPPSDPVQPTQPPRPAVGTTVLVDELDPGFSWNGPNRWERATGQNGHHYFTWATPSTADACGGTTQHDSGTWTATLPAQGKYRVEVFVPEWDATTQNARYQVSTDAGTQLVSVNQNLIYDQWVPLGTFQMSSARIHLDDITGEPCLEGDDQRRIAFDAVRWVYVG